MADKEKYKRRLTESARVVDEHFGTNGVSAEHERADEALSRLQLWIGVLAGRPELPALNAAADELDSGLHNLACGLYREAYGNLRLNLELSMAAVNFSVDELALRQWLRDKSDIVWSALIRDVDKETYALNSAFVEAFNEDMGGRWSQFRTIANTLHRELSAHVHGAASTQRASRVLEFRRDTALDWFTKCQNGQLSWQYVMLARYSDLLRANRATLGNPFKDMLKALFTGTSEAHGILSDLGCMP